MKCFNVSFHIQASLFSDWYDAVDKFSTRIPALADELKTLVEQEHKTNAGFKDAFAGFYQTCRTAINPDLSQAAVEEIAHPAYPHGTDIP